MELKRQPPVVCLAKNQIGWKVYNQNATVDGTKAVNRLTVHSLPTAASGTYLRFKLLEHEFFFYCYTSGIASIAPYSGQGFPEPTPGFPIETWVRNVLADWLQRNILIDTYFDIVTYPGNDYLDLVAKKAGPQYEMTELFQGEDIFGATNSMFNWRSLSVETNGVADAYNDIRVTQHLFVEETFGSGIWTELRKVEHACDSEGNTTFDAAEKIIAYLTGFDIPAHDATAPGVCVNIQKRFRSTFDIFAQQMINGNNTVYQHNYHVALKAGVRKHDFIEVEDILEDWIKPNNWLSWRPNERAITRNQAEFLSLLFWPERKSQQITGPGGTSNVPDQVFVKAQLYYTDGTNEEVTVHTENSLQRYQIGYFPVGYDIIEPLATSAKTVEYYEIFAYLSDHIDGNISIGKTVTYILTDEGFNDRYFMYENSFGCFDTLRTQGYRINQVSIEKEVLSRLLPIDYDVFTSEQQSKLKALNFPSSCSLVVENKTEFKALVDFLISDKVFLIEDGKMKEVIVAADTFDFGQDDDYTFTLNFEFDYAVQEKAYSVI